MGHVDSGPMAGTQVGPLACRDEWVRERGDQEAEMREANPREGRSCFCWNFQIPRNPGHAVAFAFQVASLCRTHLLTRASLRGLLFLAALTRAQGHIFGV